MKVLKLVVILLLVVAVLVIGGVATFVTTTDPNSLKPRIVDAVREATGRELTLEGPLEWAFWPQLRLRAGPLTLSNAAGFGEEPMLAAQTVQVAVATLPLLRQRYELDTVVLHGVRINLERRADGSTNFDDFAQGGDDAAEGGAVALVLGGVDIQDAALRWRDASTGQDLRLSGINVSTGALTYGKPVALEAKLRAESTLPVLDADVALSGTVSYDLDNEHYVVAPLALTATLRGQHLPGGEAPISFGAALDINLAEQTVSVSALDLNGLDTRVTGEFKARDIDAARPSASGALAVEGKDLARLFGAFKLPVGKQLAAVGDRTFKLDAAFDADMDSGVVTVERLDGRVLGAELTGRFEANRANTDTPVAKGELKARGPDLPTLAAVAGTLNGADAKALRSLEAAFAGVKDRSFDIEAVLDADLGAGRADLPRLQARLLGNRLEGEVFAQNARAEQPAFKGRLETSGPDLAALLATLSAFQADGTALRDMAARLAGEKQRDFSAEASFDTDLATGRIEVPTVSADLLGLAVRGALTGSGVDFEHGKGKLDGTLAVTGDNLGPLLRTLDQADLARSVRRVALDAGLKGSPSDLEFAPLALVATIDSPELGKPVELTVKAGSARANLEQETLAVKELRVRGLGLDAVASLEASAIRSKPAYSGTLDVPAFDLRKLLRTLNKPVPKTADPKALGRLGLAARFKGTTSALAFEDVKLALDDTAASGRFEIADFAGPALRFDLAVDAIDADRYLEPAKDGGPRAATPEAAAAGAASEIPVETLRGLDIKGSLALGKLTLSGARMTNVKVAINAKGGRIRLDPLAARLYDGQYGGVITLDATGSQTELVIDTRLDGVRLEPLLVDVAQNDSLSGTLAFDARFKATGGSAERLTRSLDGKGNFAAREGIFRGVDAVAVLRAVEQIIECKCPVPVPKGGETRFASLTGSLTAKDGILRNKDLVMAGDGFAITGQGTLANLHDNTLKYDLELGVAEQRAQQGTANYNLGGYKVPIECRGALSEPRCLPDLDGIIKQVAKGAVKKKVEKAIGKQLEKAIGGEGADALKQLFKF